MGTEDLKEYVRNYKLTIKSYIAKRLQNWERQPWDALIHKGNSHLVTREALDFLDKLLVYDREKRIAPKEAMEHEYFKPVREFHEKKENDAMED